MMARGQLGPIKFERNDSFERGEEEQEELEEDLEIETLIAVARMNLEAALAYEASAELVATRHLSEMLLEFADDHHRHVRDLGTLVEARTERAVTLPQEALNSVFTTFTSALSMIGNAEAVLALLANEQFANAAYMAALEVVTDEEARALLERHVEDEQRHLNCLMSAEKQIREDALRPVTRPQHAQL